jgi:uncharacterized membrane protein
MRWSTLRKGLLPVLAAASVTYPFLVYFGLPLLSARTLFLVLIAFICLRAALFATSKRWGAAALTCGLAIGIAALGWWAGELHAMRLYPVLVSGLLACVFSLTLHTPPPMIERLARLRTPDLDAYAIGYTRRLTEVWVGFFILNGGISAWTAFAGTLDQWMLYNGLISYILIGVLFVGEWPVRALLRRRHDRRVGS